jgi:hypothetical protein
MLIIKHTYTSIVFATTLLLGINLFWTEETKAISFRREPIAVKESSEQSTANLFNDKLRSGSLLDTNKSQLEPFLFELPTTGNLTVTFHLLGEVAGNRNVNEFGIYDSEANYKTIFDGAFSVGNSVTIAIKSDGNVVLGNGNTFQLKGKQFGFSLRNPINSFYTEDSKNNGYTQALMYQGGQELAWGDSTLNFGEDDLLLAWEDQKYQQSDRDYNDMIVIAEGILGQGDREITEIPEPSLLTGLGFLVSCLSICRRDRNNLGTFVLSTMKVRGLKPVTKNRK